MRSARFGAPITADGAAAPAPSKALAGSSRDVCGRSAALCRPLPPPGPVSCSAASPAVACVARGVSAGTGRPEADRSALPARGPEAAPGPPSPPPSAPVIARQASARPTVTSRWRSPELRSARSTARIAPHRPRRSSPAPGCGLCRVRAWATSVLQGQGKASGSALLAHRPAAF